MHEIGTMVAKAKKDKAKQIVTEMKFLLRSADADLPHEHTRKKIEIDLPKGERVKKPKHYQKKKKRRHIA